MKYYLTYTGKHKKTAGTVGGTFLRNVEVEVTKNIADYFKDQKYFTLRVEEPPEIEKIKSKKSFKRIKEEN